MLTRTQGCSQGSWRARFGFLWALAATGAGAPLLPGQAAAAGPPALAVHFASNDAAATDLTGLLRRPPGSGPFAAVVMLHGCSGMLDGKGRLKRRPAFWSDWLVNKGYVVLLADSFAPRGLSSICGIKERPILPERERPFDAYGALRYLQAQPFVKAGRVVLMGWSNGAMTLLWTLQRGARQRPAGLPADFRAGVGFYPGCVKLGRRPYMTDVPLLLQLGAADDWTPAAPCLRLADGARQRGADITIDSYPGAYHNFDHPKSRVRTIVTRNSDLKGGEKRVHIGTDRAARAAAIARVGDFLLRHLGY